MKITEQELKHLQKVYELLGYTFRSPKYLLIALTHRSYINVLKKEKGYYYTNERLEFLGDAVLELIISEYLFKTYPKLSEGVLTLIRAAVVRTESLAEVMRKIGIGPYIFLGKGERKTGGEDKPYILANVFEAMVGAIYLDGGYRNAKEVVLRWLKPRIKKVVASKSYIDPKTRLQEVTQKHFKSTPVYEIISEEGKAHERIYTAVVKIDGKILGKGSGSSKQRAHEEAAQEALEKLDKIIVKGNVKD